MEFVIEGAKTGMGNTVIKRSDLMNMYFKDNKIKDKQKFDFDSADTHEEYVKLVHEVTNNLIEDFKTTYRVFAKSKLANIKAKFKAIVILSSNLRDHAKLLDDVTLITNLDVIGNQLIKIEDKLKEGKYTKVSDLKKALKLLYMTKIKKVTIDEAPMAYLDEDKEGFSKLKNVSIPSKGKVIFAMNAPLMFSGMLNNKNVKNKLTTGLKLKTLAGYSLFDNAKFVVLDESKMKQGMEREETVNKFFEKVNRGINNPVIPIHDISTEIKGKYVVWVVPQMYAKYISIFIESMDDSQIFVS